MTVRDLKVGDVVEVKHEDCTETGVVQSLHEGGFRFLIQSPRIGENVCPQENSPVGLENDVHSDGETWYVLGPNGTQLGDEDSKIVTIRKENQ